jgi:hypothetical protein
MTQFVLTGDDSLIIDDIDINKDFPNGDTAVIEFQNNLAGMATGKELNTVFAKDESGNNFRMTIRVLRNSKSDIYLNGKQILQTEDFPAFVLLTGSFSKRLGDGLGNVTYDGYTLNGMIFEKKVPAKANLNGDTEQGVSTYVLIGAAGQRVMM